MLISGGKIAAVAPNLSGPTRKSSMPGAEDVAFLKTQLLSLIICEVC